MAMAMKAQTICVSCGRGHDNSYTSYCSPCKARINAGWKSVNGEENLPCSQCASMMPVRWFMSGKKVKATYALSSTCYRCQADGNPSCGACEKVFDPEHGTIVSTRVNVPAEWTADRPDAARVQVCACSDKCASSLIAGKIWYLNDEAPAPVTEKTCYSCGTLHGGARSLCAACDARGWPRQNRLEGKASCHSCEKQKPVRQFFSGMKLRDASTSGAVMRHSAGRDCSDCRRSGKGDDTLACWQCGETDSLSAVSVPWAVPPTWTGTGKICVPHYPPGRQPFWGLAAKEGPEQAASRAAVSIATAFKALPPPIPNPVEIIKETPLTASKSSAPADQIIADLLGAVGPLVDKVESLTAALKEEASRREAAEAKAEELAQFLRTSEAEADILREELEELRSAPPAPSASQEQLDDADTLLRRYRSVMGEEPVRA
jgi:hypothetical protein